MEGLEVRDNYTRYAYNIISKGYIKGGIDALKKKYPNSYEEMEMSLKKDFSMENVRKYCDDFVAGLKQVGKWKVSK